MQFNTEEDSELKEIWALIIKKMYQEGEEICPNSQASIKHKTAQSVHYEEKMEI